MKFKFKFFKVVLACFIVSVSGMANAGLIDNGAYTTDDATSLDWLDWTATVGMTNAEAVGFYTDYRLATHIEFLQLFNNAFERELIYNSSNYASGVGDPYRDTVLGKRFISLVGATNVFETFVTLEGEGLYGVGLNVHAGYEDSAGYRVAGRFDAWNGVGLVRATAEVPEPATLAIFALGMIGLASRRFKKQF